QRTNRPEADDLGRDQVDFTWLASGLRRLKLLGPARPRAGEQLTLFGPTDPLAKRVAAWRWGKPGPARLGRRLRARVAAAGDRGAAASSAPAPVPADVRARVLLVLAGLGYVALFVHWTFRNHDGLGTQAYDLGIFDQGVW